MRISYWSSDVCSSDLMAAQQRRCDLATAFECHVAQFARVDTRGLGDQRGLHPVLAADGTAGTDHHGTWIFLQCLYQIIEVLVGRIALHRDGAITGANGCQPANGVFVETTELALGQVQQRATGTGRSEERRVGKSVSVRVDLGGRRSIKKKKNNKDKNNK